MTPTYRTEQEAFWAGDFGNDYIARNQDATQLAGNLARFSEIINNTGPLGSVLELGANVGMNLRALHQLLPNTKLSAVEINTTAVDVLQQLGYVDARHGSILDFATDQQWDLVFTSGVLIHINPDELPKVYDLMHRASRRYVLVAEYYNPVPVEVSYRGHSGKLFKRDFAGDLLDRYPDLQLVRYGFNYRRDLHFPHADISWFLLEKRPT
jgi:spore coat polysaccharide biosynthesis protein SpsF